MTLSVRDGAFDLVIVAGPGVAVFPSEGARVLARECAAVGLRVAWVGGDWLQARGLIPLPGTGAVVLAEDPQGRLHRLQARAVVRMARPSTRPDPFPGSCSDALLELSVAQELFREGAYSFSPSSVILGTGNPALRFGSKLLESGVSEVLCIETHADWGAKRYAGWEVERRRFEVLGGKLIEARPLTLIRKGPLKLEFRVEDERGIRILEPVRVVSAGPFSASAGVREYPPGSSLYELEQTAPAASVASQDLDAEGWVLESDRALALAMRVVRGLCADLPSEERERVEKTLKKARFRMKRHPAHREAPYSPAYQGKWLSHADSTALRSFSGTPRLNEFPRTLASIECFEEIGCRECQKVCPTGAIDLSARGSEKRVLNEAACTACGICVSGCPSGAISMLEEREGGGMVRLTLPWRGKYRWKPGVLATLVNRRGETLGSARVLAWIDGPVEQVQLEVPAHLQWEARGIRAPKSTTEMLPSSPSAEDPQRVEVSIQGEKRWVRAKARLSTVLFEAGYNREGDALACSDGSCGRCGIEVDGVKRLACQTWVHPKMALRLQALDARSGSSGSKDELCPCEGVSAEKVRQTIQQAKLQSPEAVVAVTGVASGRCHGALCQEPLRRLLESEGISASDWIDWRFPWTDWKLVPGKRE